MEVSPFNKKGQIIALDALIAAIIFSVIFATFYTNYQVKISDVTKTSALEKLDTASNFLITMPGIPTSWNSTDVESIGIAGQPNELDEKKLSKLFNMSKENFSKVKEKMGLQAFNLSIKALHPNGTAIFLNNSDYSGNATIGETLSGTENTRITRIAKLHNDRIFIQMAISK